MPGPMLGWCVALATLWVGGARAATSLPPVFSIPRNTTARLDVDLFFSLFFVFLNEDLEDLSSDYTVFAPAGLTTGEVSQWLDGEDEVTEQLLLNHIVAGRHLRPELVVGEPGPWQTLGGRQVKVALDDRGEFRVNGVRVLAWTTEGAALIVVLEDFLFRQEELEEGGSRLEEEPREMTASSLPKKVRDKVKEAEEVREVVSEFPEAEPRKASRKCTKVRSKTGALSIFRRVTVCTETVEATDGEEDRLEMEDREPETRRIQDPQPSLLDQVEVALSGLLPDQAPSLQHFLSYSRQLPLQLSSKESWTVLAPVDSAWQRWTPIDWGFNPFLVPSFLNSTVQGLFIRGLVDLKEQGRSWTSLAGGRLEVVVKGENTYLGGSLVQGWMELPGGRLLVLEQLPGVTADTVEQLEELHPALVSSPPLAPLSPPGEWLTVSDRHGLTVLQPGQGQEETSKLQDDPDREIRQEDELFNVNIEEVTNDSVNFPEGKIVGELRPEELLAGRGDFLSEDSLAQTLQESSQDPVLVKAHRGLEEGQVAGGDTRVVYINNQRVELPADQHLL